MRPVVQVKHTQILVIVGSGWAVDDHWPLKSVAVLSNYLFVSDGFLDVETFISYSDENGTKLNHTAWLETCRCRSLQGRSGIG